MHFIGYVHYFCFFTLDIPTINVIVTIANEATLGGLYLLVCSSMTSKINFIYTSTYQWYHNEVILMGRTA